MFIWVFLKNICNLVKCHNPAAAHTVLSQQMHLHLNVLNKQTDAKGKVFLLWIP